LTAQIDNKTGEANSIALDIDCIEANDFNISSGRYKPFELHIDDIELPTDLIKKIQVLENEIQLNLNGLLEMLKQ